MLLVTRRLFKINNQFGFESSTTSTCLPLHPVQTQKVSSTNCEVVLVGCEIRKRTLKRKHVLEPTLQWSAVLLIHTKARQSVPLTNVEDQTGI